jgi:SAM-dependent methyltransferase
MPGLDVNMITRSHQFPSRTKREAAGADYDSKHDIHTCGIIEADNLTIESNRRADAVRYEAVYPDWFRDAIGSLNIDPNDFLFVDIGAGKGRALFLAQDVGFRRIIGVEFAKELVAICQKNIRCRTFHRVERPPLEIVHMDAVLYPLPQEPMVLYMYNPFGEKTMRNMARRIRDSLFELPRPLKIVYVTPRWDAVIMSGVPRIRRVAKTPEFASYEWTGGLEESNFFAG